MQSKLIPTLELNGIRAMTINFQLEEFDSGAFSSSFVCSLQLAQLDFHMWQCFGMPRDFQRFFLLFPIVIYIFPV